MILYWKSYLELVKKKLEFENDSGDGEDANKESTLKNEASIEIDSAQSSSKTNKDKKVETQKKRLVDKMVTSGQFKCEGMPPITLVHACFHYKKWV